ncbi:hypothetical protein CASFOL_038985 [Castilleja foliolosa]|uniref:Transposase, Ptta/En/Spm, plant n=1 Tax=Castilleja foliolosa TaxID=1961234 RepID=A0ABD3BJ51_9LAMI
MENPVKRLTRSCARLAAARFAAAREENVDGGDPSAPRQPGPVNTDKGSKWAFAFLDANFSKRLGVQSSKELPVEPEEMAPGGAAVNQKTRFAQNNASFSYPSPASRRINRALTDELNVSSLKESTHMPKSSELLLGKKSLTPQPKSANTKTQSTDQRTKSNSQHNKSVGSKSQSVNTETYSSSQTSQPSSNQNKSGSHQNQSNITQPHSVNPETHSNSPETNSNSPQSQSTGQNTQSSSPENHSTASQTQSVARQMQQIAPQPDSVGLQNEADSPPTIQRGLRDETDDTNDTNNTTDTNDTDETDETAAVSTVEKRKRGPTMGRGLMKALGGSKGGKKMKIEVDPAIGRPKDRVESAKFSSQVGVVARDVLPVPRKWKEIDVQSALNPCIDHMQIHMDVNMDKPGVKQCVIDRLKSSSRQQRYRLHQHYKKFANLQEAKRNKPAQVSDQQQWELLCDHFESPEFKNQSQANSNNRKKMRAKHITGRTPFTIIQNEISGQKGDDCDMIELYKTTHENVKGKWSSDVAKENWELMVEKKEKYAEEGIEKSEQEIVTEVLGHANGYIKGLGYGPKPPGKRNSQLHKELEDTRAELEESRTDKEAYKSTVDALTDQLKEQAAQIAKLMAFMQAGGSSVAEEGNQELDDSNNS